MTSEEILQVLQSELDRYVEIAKENQNAGNTATDAAFDQGIIYGFKYAIEAIDNADKR